LKTKKISPSIYFTTLGCAKNLVDSENLMGKLSASGFDVRHESGKVQADIAIVNTCGFISDAKEESIDVILGLVEAKKSGRFKAVYVMGCLSQRYKTELQADIPGIDGIFGVNEQNEILKALGVDYRKHLLGERLVTTPAHYAYLKIAEGCDRQCSFCAIPAIRGKNISRTVEDILREAAFLASKGVKELNIIAQDTTYYGLDLYGKRKLAFLLEKLSDTPGLEWIRLHYAYPLGFPLEVLDVIREKDNICKYIDIPLQHINPAILKSMKRGLSKTETVKLLDNIRKQIPGVAIRTTLITGYPGEGTREFRELYEFVKEQEFDRLGIFKYSPEEGTSAYPLGNPVPETIKAERSAEIMQAQMDISARLNAKKIGRDLKVIIDKEEDGNYIGRTEFDSPDVDNEVIIKNTKETLGTMSLLVPGQFYKVRVTGADFYDLTAELIPSSI
jgi:ribosomal protein S12 methylthiotransferase